MGAFDTIIVGQGLAGSILAYKLIERGERVLVLDNHHVNSASLVAAGIINPVTGHRLNITEGFETFYPEATGYYQSLENRLGIRCWQPCEQLRLIKNPGQFSYYQQRRQQAGYADILGQHISECGAFPHAEFGAVEIRRTAVVHTRILLEGVRSWLIEQQAYQAKRIDHTQIIRHGDQLVLGDASANRLIFCEGYRAIDNPWLTHLPFKLSKGEIVTLAMPEPVKQLLNWGHWLAPGAQHARLGSNYAWNDLSTDTSEEVKSDLLQSLAQYTGIEAEVVQHDAGIRPTTRQRKPFIGPVRELANAYCFNGFGSKGCLLIPHYADLLCDHLMHNAPLPRELTQWL